MAQRGRQTFSVVVALVLAAAAPADLSAEHAELACSTSLGCPAGALACVDVANRTGAEQQAAVITFGHSFQRGALPSGTTLAVYDSAGQRLALQLDQPARYSDGSLRYAVITVRVPRLTPRGHGVLALRGAPAADDVATSSPPLALPSSYSAEIKLRAYAAQINQVVFGNRDGFTPGIPFKVGERIAIALGDDPSDRYELTVTSDLAGGDYEALTRLSKAFMNLINRGGRYRAYKIGEGGGWERLWITSREAPGRPFQVRIEYAGAARITVSLLQPWEAPRDYSASVAAALKREAAARTKTWLSGPLARELALSMPFVAADGTEHPRLAARFDVRVQSDGRVRTDAVIENVWTFVEPRNEIYDVAMLEGGTPVFSRKAILHIHHARWHRVLWWAGSPIESAPFEVKHDPVSLIASAAVPNYDTKLEISSVALDRELSELRATDTGPLGSAMITTYMPTGGGRDDIGLLPRWDVLYLLTMDPRAKSVALANTDAAAGAPVHYRDRRSGLPISIDTHPRLTVFYGKAGPEDAIPAGTNVDTDWSVDSAHQPAVAYLAYLLSGDHYYLDELHFWASWNLAKMDPELRGAAAGLVRDDELRGQAWSLRTLANAIYVTPDDHPLKAYFERKLTTNLNWYIEHYPRNPDSRQAPRLGWLPQPGMPDEIPPWSEDFFALVMAELVEMGFEDARPMVDWTARFAIGRWVNGASGYCPAMAPAYLLKINRQDGRPIERWDELFRANWPDVHSCPERLISDGDPDLPIGYAAIARATLAALAGLGHPQAMEAWQRLRDATPAITAAYSDDPTWAIVPRVPAPAASHAAGTGR